jgi:hypothetical protein
MVLRQFLLKEKINNVCQFKIQTDLLYLNCFFYFLCLNSVFFFSGIISTSNLYYHFEDAIIPYLFQHLLSPNSFFYLYVLINIYLDEISDAASFLFVVILKRLIPSSRLKPKIIIKNSKKYVYVYVN